MCVRKLWLALIVLGLAGPVLELHGSAWGQSGPLFEGADRLSLNVSLDGFRIQSICFQANASFSIVYQFEIGKDSHPMHIYALAGQKWLDDPRAAEAGLATWTLVGLGAGKKYVLVLNWQHAKGYVLMSIVSDQLSLSVRLLKD